MLTKDYHQVPKVRDKWSWLYIEHGIIDREDKAIAVHDLRGLTPIPCDNLSVLLLGPGTSITHAAITTLADCGCLVVWSGEQGVRFYASGSGATRKASHLLRQVKLWANEKSRLYIVRRMYEFRFPEKPDPSLTLEQIRGMEGVRVRDAYFRASRDTGVPWKGRNYDRRDWKNADPINKALSVANSCLYGISHAAIVAAGYSPAIGFVHTGKQLSFVYDVADLYKTELTIPVAFQTVAEVDRNLSREVRIRCRDMFHQQGLLKRIVKDIHDILGAKPPEDAEDDFDADPAKPGGLWDPVTGECAGGVSYGEGGDKEEE